MKKLTILLLLTCSFLFSTCSICSSYKARRLLENCTFDITSAKLKKIGGIASSDPTAGAIFGALQMLSGGQPTAEFDIIMSVINPNEDAVMLDSMAADLLLDDTFVSHLKLNKYIKVEPGDTAYVPISAELPLKPELLNLVNAKVMTLTGTVWMKFELFFGISPVFGVPVTIKEKV